MAYQKTDLPGNPVFDPETGQYGYEITTDGYPPGEYIMWRSEPIPFGEDHPFYDPEQGIYTYDIVSSDLPPIKVTFPEPPEIWGTRFLLTLAEVTRESERKKAIAEKRRSLDTE